MANHNDIEEILNFWFGPLDERGVCRQDRNGFWFGNNPETDRTVKRNFGTLVEKAGRNDLDDWAETPRGRLALIILLDQFTRNIYRGTAQAFSHDPKARHVCLEGMEKGHDTALSPSERSFYYLPLEHSESPEDQSRCVAAYRALHAGLDPSLSEQFQVYVDYAVKHKELIDRFGRFPHRNAVLNREPKPDEHAYLAESGETFGQG